MKQKFASLALFFLLAILVLPTVSGAATGDPLPGAVSSPIALLQKIEAVTNWVFAFFMVVSVVFILMAAFEFVTGGPEGAKEARQKLIWAIVGIVIAVLARSIPDVIKIIVTQ